MSGFDPKRLVDSGTLAPFGRALLESDKVRAPSDAECEALWASLSDRLGPSGLGIVTSRVPRSGLGVLGKAALAAIVAGTTVFAMATLHPRVASSERGASAAAGLAAIAASADWEVLRDAPIGPGTAATPPPVEAPHLVGSPVGARQPTEVPRHARPRAAVERPAAPAPQRPQSEPDELRAESGLVLRAHQALRAGACQSALEGLAEARARFPNGALAEERDALTVRALACAGRTAEAAERAGAFVQDHPTSPYVAIVGRFTRAAAEAK